MPRRALACVVVLLAVAAALACGGGGGGGGGTPTQPPPPAQTLTIEIHDFTYTPRSVSIRPGDTVVWVMRGSDPTHTVTELNGTFDSGTVFNAQGATYQRTFTAADNNRTFNVQCRAHADCCQMRGSIRVGTNAPTPNPGYE